MNCLWSFISQRFLTTRKNFLEEYTKYRITTIHRTNLLKFCNFTHIMNFLLNYCTRKVVLVRKLYKSISSTKIGVELTDFLKCSNDWFLQIFSKWSKIQMKFYSLKLIILAPLCLVAHIVEVDIDRKGMSLPQQL